LHGQKLIKLFEFHEFRRIDENGFIPSRDGDWLVIGVPLLKAAQSLGADFTRVIMAFCYGDGLTNLLNPFWTLTVLPIMAKLLNLRPKDFMGYTSMSCIVMFIAVYALQPIRKNADHRAVRGSSRDFQRR